MDTPTRSQNVSHQFLFFLRFVQGGSIAITGFIVCYFIWWHNNLAGASPVPRGYITLLSACIYAFLELYITTAISLSSHRTSPNYRSLSLTTLLSALLLSLGYYELRQIPYIRAWCEGNDFAPLWRNIEEASCTLVCDVIVAGAIALGFTWILTIFATVKCVLERKDRGVKLEYLPVDYEDDRVVEGEGEKEEEGDLKV